MGCQLSAKIIRVTPNSNKTGIFPGAYVRVRSFNIRQANLFNESMGSLPTASMTGWRLEVMRRGKVSYINLVKLMGISNNTGSAQIANFLLAGKSRMYRLVNRKLQDMFPKSDKASRPSFSTSTRDHEPSVTSTSNLESKIDHVAVHILEKMEEMNPEKLFHKAVSKSRDSLKQDVEHLVMSTDPTKLLRLYAAYSISEGKKISDFDYDMTLREYQESKLCVFLWTNRSWLEFCAIAEALAAKCGWSTKVLYKYKFADVILDSQNYLRIPPPKPAPSKSKFPVSKQNWYEENVSLSSKKEKPLPNQNHK